MGKHITKAISFFVGAMGGRFLQITFHRSFRFLLKAAGLPHIRFHELRHSSASNLLNMGFSLKDAQEWLGHSDIKTTANVYGHLDAKRKISMAKALDFGT